MAGAFSGHVIQSYEAASRGAPPTPQTNMATSENQSNITNQGGVSFNPNMHGTFNPQPSPSFYPPYSPERLQEKLAQQLGPEYLSTRPGPGGGPKLTYVEGWKIINLANEIFGYDGWSSNIVTLAIDFIEVDEASRRCNVGVSAVIRVTVAGARGTTVSHEDIGYGSAENAKSKSQALDKAKKEAVTDGLKRALRLFGNAIGNCTYDKTYIKEVAKVKVAPVKFDSSTLHRRPEQCATASAAPPPNPPSKQEQKPSVPQQQTRPVQTSYQAPPQQQPRQTPVPHQSRPVQQYQSAPLSVQQPRPPQPNAQASSSNYSAASYSSTSSHHVQSSHASTASHRTNHASHDVSSSTVPDDDDQIWDDLDMEDPELEADLGRPIIPEGDDVTMEDASLSLPVDHSILGEQPKPQKTGPSAPQLQPGDQVPSQSKPISNRQKQLRLTIEAERMKGSERANAGAAPDPAPDPDLSIVGAPFAPPSNPVHTSGHLQHVNRMSIHNGVDSPRGIFSNSMSNTSMKRSLDGNPRKPQPGMGLSAAGGGGGAREPLRSLHSEHPDDGGTNKRSRH